MPDPNPSIIDNFIGVISGTVDVVNNFFITARNIILSVELGSYSFYFILLFLVFILVATSLISSPFILSKYLEDNTKFTDKLKKVINNIIGK